MSGIEPESAEESLPVATCLASDLFNVKSILRQIILTRFSDDFGNTCHETSHMLPNLIFRFHSSVDCENYRLLVKPQKPALQRTLRRTALRTEHRTLYH